MPNSRPILMTIIEVSRYLRVHRSTVYRLVRERGLPAIKVGNQWRFNKAQVEGWLVTNQELKGVESCR